MYFNETTEYDTFGRLVLYQIIEENYVSIFCSRMQLSERGSANIEIGKQNMDS